MKLLGLLLLSASQIILDYQFGRNYGDVFYDFSGSKYHAVNGDGNGSFKVKSTDRGVYFSQSYNYIKLPNTLDLQSDYTAVFWVLAENTETYIFSRIYNLDKGFWAFGRKSTSNMIHLNNYGKLNEKIDGFLNCNAYLAQWLFFRIKYGSNMVKIYVNESKVLQISLSLTEACPCSTFLGSSQVLPQPSMSGFMWRFSIISSLASVSTHFVLSSTTTCLINILGCSACTSLIIDPFYGQGCLPTLLNPQNNTYGIPCKSSDLCYFTTTLLSCSVSGVACIFNAQTKTCLSIDLQTGVQVQIQCECLDSSLKSGLSCEDNDCATKDSFQRCLSCIDNNAEPINGRCYCKTGFSGELLITFNGKCVGCSSACLECSSVGCKSCVDQNAEVLSGICKCKAGYYFSNSTNKCIYCDQTCLLTYPCTDIHSILINETCGCKDGYYLNGSGSNCSSCDSECKTCSSLIYCLSCNDVNAQVSSGICLCQQGYYKINKTCEKCDNLCKTCNSVSICETCSDSNAHLITGGTCECNQGFFLDTFNICQRCLPSCLSCNSSDSCISCIATQAFVEKGICKCPLNYVFNDFYDNCLECPIGCSVCDTAFNCLKCFDINAVVDLVGNCICVEGYFFDQSNGICSKCLETCKNCTNGLLCESCLTLNSFGENCESCHENCKICNGPEEFNCLSCTNSSLLNGYCLKICPLGFEEVDGACEMKETTKVFWVTFESFGKYYDLIHNLTLEFEENNNSRLLLDSSIRSSYKRGIYCRGSGYLINKLKDQMLLAQSFAFAIWFNSLNESGMLISRFVQNISDYSYQDELQSLQFESLLSIFRVKLSGIQVVYSSTLSLSLKSWNHIFASVVFTTVSSLQLRVNNIADKVLSIESRYKEDFQSSLFIADSPSFKLPYHGFIFSIEIFSTMTSFDSLDLKISSNDCLGCEICPSGKECIPNCLFEEFYDEDSDSCKICQKDCDFGCKTSVECNTCIDNFCQSCYSLKEKSCFKCNPGFIVSEGLCKECPIQQFYDIKTEKCRNCLGLCFTCLSEKICTSCKDNSYLDQGSCFCDEAFEDIHGVCVRGNFTAKCWISKNFEINLVFQESLQEDLKKSDVILKIDNHFVDFTVNKIDSFNFVISPIYSLEIDIKIEIFIISKIFSKKQHLLISKNFTHTFKVPGKDSQSTSTKQQIEAAEKSAQVSLAASLVTSISISMMSMDPSSVFDFMNTAEIFYSIYLFDLELNPILENFLMHYRIQGYIPNAFSYVLNEKKGKKLPKKIKKFGYRRSLALVNLGPQLQTLAFCLILWIFTEIFSLVTCCKKRLEKTRKNFKFNVFLRFWIQSFLECLIACFVSFKYGGLENNTQVVDFSLIVLFCTTQLTVIVIFLHLLRKRNKINDEDETRRFLGKFGELFQDFKEGLANQFFFFFFILRRLLLLFCYAFVKDRIFQLAISISFSMIVIFIQLPFYLVTKRVFIRDDYNYYHILNEIIISTYHFLVLFSYVSHEKQSNYFANICYYFVLISAGINIAFRGYATIKEIIQKIREYFRRNKGKVYQERQGDKISNIIGESNEVKNTKISFEVN